MGRSERKAIFAGHFNPFHLGHAYAIRKSLEIVDEILVYLAVSMHAPNKFLASLDGRRRIIEKWVELNKDLDGRVQVYHGTKKNADLHEDGYTIEICGSDVFNYSKDHDWEPFRATKEFIVLKRPKQEITAEALEKYTQPNGKIVHIVPCENKREVNLSGTYVREKLGLGKRIKELVPPGLEAIIKEVYPTNLNVLDQRFAKPR